MRTEPVVEPRPRRTGRTRVRRALAVTCSISVVLLGGIARDAGAHSPRPDGQILFTQYDPTIDDFLPFTVNPDGSHARQIYPLGLGCPHWSPDGTQLAGCGTPTGDGTTILNVDTGQARYLPFLAAGLFSPCFVWSANGRRLACEGAGDTDPSLNGIYTVRVRDWGKVERVTWNPGGDDLPGSYSPNGRRISFARFDADGNSVGLFVVNVNGSGLTRITPVGSDSSPGDWSKRGNEIIFSMRAAPDRRLTLWVVHPDGSGLHQLVLAPDYPCGGAFSDPTSIGCSNPVWSPSGEHIAFLINNATGHRAFTADADGQHVRLLADNTDDDNVRWGTHPLAG